MYRQDLALRCSPGCRHLSTDSKESLSSSLSESPRNSAEHIEHSSPNHTTLPSSSSSNAMWRTQQLTHARISSSSSSLRSVSRTKRTAPASNMSPPRVHPPIAPFSSSNSLPSTSALTLPILRWFGKQSTGQHHLPRSHSISRSPPPLNSDGELSASSSRSSICSSPTSPPSALREAFEDDIRLCHLPVRARIVHLPTRCNVPRPPVCPARVLAGLVRVVYQCDGRLPSLRALHGQHFQHHLSPLPFRSPFLDTQRTSSIQLTNHPPYYLLALDILVPLGLVHDQ